MKNVVLTRGVSLSKSFLLPLTNIGRSVKCDSYLYWEDRGIDNYELVVVVRDGYIDKNPLLLECYDNIYIFDLSQEIHTVDLFLEGRYSKFPEYIKKKIIAFHGEIRDKTKAPKGAEFLTALYPQYYYEGAAQDLGMTLDELRGCELCELPDREIETYS
jgi:hypothetical protein